MREKKTRHEHCWIRLKHKHNFNVHKSYLRSNHWASDYCQQLHVNCHVRASILSSLLARVNKINAKIMKMSPEGLRRLSPRSRLHQEKEQLPLYLYLRSPGQDTSIHNDAPLSFCIFTFARVHHSPFS